MRLVPPHLTRDTEDSYPTMATTALRASIPVAESDEKWVLLATILPASMGFISTSGLDAAAPAVQTALDINSATLFWIINVYALFLSALILVGGSLGDHLGRKRVYMAGITLFSVASMACGLAPDAISLILFRAVQGVGAALMVPGSLAILTALIAPERRGRAIGWWSTFSAVTSVLGAPLGGWLAGAGLWRAVFFVNIPLGIIALAVLYLRVPESRDEDATGALDYLGALLATLGLGGLTFGFLQGAEVGFGEPRVIAGLVLGVAGMLGFVVWEARSPHPMVSLRLFRSATFAGANLLTLFLYAALRIVPFFLVLNLVQVQGYPLEIAGLTLLPLGLTLTIMGRWAGGLVDRMGPRLPLMVGPAVAGFGFAAMALPGLTDGPYAYWTTFFPGIMLMSVGMAITVAPLTTTVMSAVPSSQSGTASGINNAVSRTAGVLALAVVGALAIVMFRAALDGRLAEIPGLPEDAYTVLMDEEARELAAAMPPESLDEAVAAEVNAAIDDTFIETFRLVAMTGAVMAWLSAVMTFFLIRNEAVTGDDTPAGDGAAHSAPIVQDQGCHVSVPVDGDSDEAPGRVEA